ncbi:MAG: hypothetical protein AVO33_10745 [delta proteobacterium ML8_F1]|nr:MAG: hypothetical protein AVO33_10745 [delta proteobacterium ML8_F1]
MIEMTVAKEPFRFLGEDYQRYYEYYIMLENDRVQGVLHFEVFPTRIDTVLTRKAKDDFFHKDALFRGALNHMAIKGITHCKLEGEVLEFFETHYRQKKVLKDHVVDIPAFFAEGCGGH